MSSSSKETKETKTLPMWLRYAGVWEMGLPVRVRATKLDNGARAWTCIYVCVCVCVHV